MLRKLWLYIISVHTISVSLDFCFLHYSSVRTIDLCTKQWYTFSGLIAQQMVVISFKLEKDFLCNFYCTIFEYNYGLLYIFFSFVCYNVLSFFFFKRFLIFSIHTSNMNWRYNYKNILGFYLSRICYEIYFDRTCFKINIWNIWYDWIFVPRDWCLFIKKKKKKWYEIEMNLVCMWKCIFWTFNVRMQSEMPNCI